jgi:hypothetical protein
VVVLTDASGCRMGGGARGRRGVVGEIREMPVLLLREGEEVREEAVR